MRKALFFKDVPDDLIKIMSTIDFSQMTEDRIKTDLGRLHTEAAKYLPLRTQQSESKEREIAEDVPMEAVNLINRFEYSQVSKFKMGIVKHAIPGFLKKNAPLKKK